MARHQIIRVRPARQRADAVEPGADVFVLRRDVEAEFLGRIVEVRDKRNIGDCRFGAEYERRRR